MLLKKLEGRVAIVTGSGRGIGRAIARKLASEGARVVVNDLDESPAEESAAAVRDAGSEALVVLGDGASICGDRFCKDNRAFWRDRRAREQRYIRNDHSEAHRRTMGVMPDVHATAPARNPQIFPVTFASREE